MRSRGRSPEAGWAPADADERSRQVRGAERRQQIIEAAAEMLAAGGSAGLDLNRLATSLGMTRPGLLYYFGTKERLVREVVEERHRVGFIPDEQRVTLKDLRERGRLNAEHATVTRMFAVLRAESIDPASVLHDYFVERDREGCRYLTEVLRASVEDGLIRPDLSLAELAGEIQATYLGFEMQWVTEPSEVDLGARVEAYIDRLLESLAPEPS